MRSIGLATPYSKLITNVEGGLAFAAKVGFPVILRPSFTMGGSGGGIAYNREDLVSILERGLDLSPGSRSARRRKRARLERVRAFEVMARPCRQRHHHLLHREFRPHGRAYRRRLHHRRAGPDPHRSGIPDDARRALLRCLREIGVDTGGSNVQFAIHPADRPHGHHRDEPARLAFLGAGLQSHRLPHRQDRRQTRRRLPPRRNPQRYHSSSTPALLRTDHRLRGRQKFRSGSSRNFPAPIRGWVLR